MKLYPFAYDLFAAKCRKRRAWRSGAGCLVAWPVGDAAAGSSLYSIDVGRPGRARELQPAIVEWSARVSDAR